MAESSRSRSHDSSSGKSAFLSTNLNQIVMNRRDHAICELMANHIIRTRVYVRSCSAPQTSTVWRPCRLSFPPLRSRRIVNGRVSDGQTTELSIVGPSHFMVSSNYEFKLHLPHESRLRGASQSGMLINVDVHPSLFSRRKSKGKLYGLKRT